MRFLLYLKSNRLESNKKLVKFFKRSYVKSETRKKPSQNIRKLLETNNTFYYDFKYLYIVYIYIIQPKINQTLT